MMLGLALMFVTSAHALDCLPFAAGATLPADGALDVPTNAKPVVEFFGEPSLDDGRMVFEIIDPEGVVVPASLEILADGDPSVWQLQPDALLAPGDGYQLRAGFDWPDGGGFEGSLTTFAVGTRVDETAPEAPVLGAVLQWSNYGGDWGPEHELTVEIASTEDASGQFYMIELADNAAMDRALLRARLGRPLTFHHGLCTFDDAAKRDPQSTWTRAVSVDGAGNISEVTMADPWAGFYECGNGGGCSTTGSGTLGWFAALGGLLGLLRRRR